MDKTRTLFYHILAITVIIIWGVTFINTKVLIMHGMSPLEIFLIRFLVAYVGILAASHRQWMADSWKDEAILALLGITGGSLYFMLENTAIGFGLVNNVSFIVCCAPLWTTILMMATDRAVRPKKRFHAGTALAILGMGLIIYNGSLILKVNPRGDLMALGAGMCWAVYSKFTRKLEHRYDALMVTRKVFFWGLVTIIPFYLLRTGSMYGNSAQSLTGAWLKGVTALIHTLSDPVVTWNILFLSIVASLLCYAAWNLAIKKLGTLTATNYMYLNPVSTVIASWLILSEPLTVLSVVGFLIILLGLALARNGS